MRTGLTGFHQKLALALAAAGLLAVSAAASPLFLAGPAKVPTPAEEKFSDAPDGVDSMVTGPRTASFRERQQLLNCEGSAWPNVPLGCYPG